jgi:preprotein translocase subunit YajC
MKKTLLAALLATSAVFADGATAQPAQGNMTQTLMMIGFAIIFFYFILWRPEQKRRKALEALRSSMKKGDRVTAMGIVGTVDRIEEATVILKMVDGSKIEVLKGAITEAHAPAEPKVEVQSDK